MKHVFDLHQIFSSQVPPRRTVLLTTGVITATGLIVGLFIALDLVVDLLAELVMCVGVAVGLLVELVMCVGVAVGLLVDGTHTFAAFACGLY